MLRKDSVFLGIFIGIAVPAIMYGLLTGINYFIEHYYSQSFKIREQTIYLVSIFMNVIPIRIYFVNFKSDKTGRGILLVTFLLMILFFMFIKPARS